MRNTDTSSPVDKSILIIGGGISGITTALEAAEAGYDTYIVERKAYLGGNVSRMNQYFPKLCPPTCGLEINFKRIKNNKRVKFFTLTEVEKIEGEDGNYDVTLNIKPRYVNENCTECNKCVEACPVERSNDFNFGLDKTKAVYLPFNMAFPMQYVIDDKVCQGASCSKCIPACKYNAIDLNDKPQTITLKVGAIVWATGWEPYDANKIDNLGFGKYPNIVTNVMLERLAALNGPTGGQILRPSDNKPPANVIFVQCAGSRYENHLPYCSAVCCMASLKQANYVREKNPDANVHIFYIDLRTLGKFEDFLTKIQSDEKIKFTKGKVAKITEDPQTHNLCVEAEDTLSGVKVKATADMVVLATGIVPNTEISKQFVPKSLDEYNFMNNNDSSISAGCVKRPMDVALSTQDATGSALTAIQRARRKS